jgi:hypothetical protein
MRRAPDPTTACEHGYALAASSAECPRCADRLVVGCPPGPRLPQTRWHKTETTLGPAAKVAITVALFAPLLVMLNALRFASHHPERALLIVPIGGLAVFAVQFMPHLWERGRVRR